MNKLLTITILTVSAPAIAYVGPGTGLSALGTVFAFLGATLLLIFGLFWYPIKRLIKAVRGQNTEQAEELNEEAKK